MGKSVFGTGFIFVNAEPKFFYDLDGLNIFSFSTEVITVTSARKIVWCRQKVKRKPLFKLLIYLESVLFKKKGIISQFTVFKSILLNVAGNKRRLHGYCSRFS